MRHSQNRSDRDSVRTQRDRVDYFLGLVYSFSVRNKTVYVIFTRRIDWENRILVS